MRATRSHCRPAQLTRTRASTSPRGRLQHDHARRRGRCRSTPRARPDARRRRRASARARRPRHLAVVDDAGLGDVERRDAGGRAARARAAPRRPRRRTPCEAVGAAAPLQLVEARELVRGSSRRRPCRSGRRATPCSSQKRSRSARPRAQARALSEPGLVVEARVDDAAVAPRLMQRDLRLLLEDDDARPRSRLEEGEARGQADDAPADDDRVHFREARSGGAHGSTVT